MNPAAQRVLSTTELLQRILLHLPVRDLLLAQCVSRSFLDLITSSLMLQEALFFRAKPHRHADFYKDAQINPVLRETFPE
jgi:hypothetical protein